MAQCNHEWRPTRRDILATTLTATSAGAVGLLPAGGVHTAGSERLRIGLIGCGGRGTGAARQAVASHRTVQIVAMGDLFDDHLAESARLLQRDVGPQCDCPPERQFTGHDAWRRVLDSGIDAVILAATPWSRPAHAAEAVARGLHVFAERPAAADLEGMRVFLAACEAARSRRLTISSGLAWRHDRPTAATVARIRHGAIGQPRHGTCRAHIGLPWRRPTMASASAQESRLRNWVQADDLSGGALLERHLDALDRSLQAFGDACPVSASPVVGSSGDAVRYRFADGAELIAEIVRSTHDRGTVDERVSGTAGTADLLNHRINGRSSWAFEETSANRWQACMDAFVHAIVSGSGGDGGIPLCRSTLVGLLGRMAVRERREVSWSELAGPIAGMVGIIGTVVDAAVQG